MGRGNSTHKQRFLISRWIVVRRLKVSPVNRALKTLFLFIISWLVGLLGYVGGGAVIYRQSIALTSGDFRFVLFWSLGAFAVSFLLLYLPALFTLRRLLHGVRPVWPFPIVAVVLGIAPTALIFFMWGGGIRSLISPEASQFHCMFVAVGLIAGFGYTRIHSHANVT